MGVGHDFSSLRYSPYFLSGTQKVIDPVCWPFIPSFIVLMYHWTCSCPNYTTCWMLINNQSKLINHISIHMLPTNHLTTYFFSFFSWFFFLSLESSLILFTLVCYWSVINLLHIKLRHKGKTSHHVLREQPLLWGRSGICCLKTEFFFHLWVYIFNAIFFIQISQRAYRRGKGGWGRGYYLYIRK